jgi:hypothetical protein
MPAPVRDVAELLGVHVHHFARRVVLVASDDTARGAVEMSQASEWESGKYSVHRGGVEPEEVTDAGRASAAQDPDFDDPSLGASRSGVWAAVGAARPVAHAGFGQGALR